MLLLLLLPLPLLLLLLFCCCSVVVVGGGGVVVIVCAGSFCACVRAVVWKHSHLQGTFIPVTRYFIRDSFNKNRYIS